MNTIKLEALIEKLQLLAAQHGGDTPVYMASDEEGNSFGTIEVGSSFEYEYGKLLIFPYEDNDPDDILTYEENAQ